MTAKNSSNKWKIIAAAIVVGVLFFMGYKCGRNSYKKTVGTTVEVKKDSIHHDTIPIPVEVKVPVPGKTQYRDTGSIQYRDTGSIQYVESGANQYQPTTPVPSRSEGELWTELNTERKYDDTLYSKDSSSKVRLQELVFQNKIKKRTTDFITADSAIKTTTILEDKGKIIVYLKASYIGSQKTPYSGIFGGFAVKTPKDLVVGAQVGRINGIDGNQYQVDVNLPIRLTKKKK